MQYVEIIDGQRTKGPRALPKKGHRISGFDKLSNEDLAKHNWYPVAGWVYNEQTHTRSETFEIVGGVATWTLTPIPEEIRLEARKAKAIIEITQATDNEIQSLYPIELQVKLLVKGIKLLRKETKKVITTEELADLDQLESITDAMELKRQEETNKKQQVTDCENNLELDALFQQWDPDII